MSGMMGMMAFLIAAPLAAQQPPAFRLNDAEVFAARGAELLAFSNWYSGLFSDSKLSGIELIHHGVRTATNGDVRLSNTPEQWDPIPELVSRRVDRAGQRVEATLRYPDYHFDYRITVRAEGRGVRVAVELDAPLPTALDGRAGFNLEFLPSAYFGRAFMADGRAGAFPREARGPMRRSAAGRIEAEPLATGTTFVLAPEDSERRVTITARGAAVSLYDGRNRAQNGWFVLRGLLPSSRTGTVLEWLITPNRIPGWTRPAVIAHSQVGYHPSQQKVAVLESDPLDLSPLTARLLRIAADGTRIVARTDRAVPWGRYLRYQYARFDFSSIREPGLYVVEFRGVRSEPFRIADDVYAGNLWQSTLDTFLPVQMDHMFVNDRYRVWHGASHLDDARQAPPGHVHFDLYAQGPATDTPFRGGEHIPGLNVGGWFDAGDFDLRTQSQYAVVQTLSLIWETFHPTWDETTVQESRRHVEIRQPDGVPDVLQQIEHGTLFLLAQYRSVGHAIAGIVEPTLDQYTHLGDAVTKTDGIAGTDDDRLAFTTASTPLNYGSIAALAAASRVLRGYNDTLATECLETATRIWREEHGHAPNLFRSGNTTGGRLEDEETKAAVELLISTNGGREYTERLAMLWPEIETHFDDLGALGARALPFMDASFRQRMERAARTWRGQLDSLSVQNPFGVPIATGGWGGAGQALGWAMRADILHRAFPSIVGPEFTQRGLNYVLGTHPASSVSMVSGIGTHSKTYAYGNNRADYSFIAGGVVPGIVIVHPDLPELKEDWPFLWYESEYVITAAAAYLYVANAVGAEFH